MVDVGGYQLHMFCAGEGKPLAMVLTGAASIAEEWEKVQSQVSQFTTICTYDRAGYDRSEAGPIPSTVSDRAEQLETLIQNARLETPLVLVAHSYGGLIARVFQHKYPSQVAGIVFVDAVDASYINQPEAKEKFAALAREYLSNKRKTQFGLMWLWLQFHPSVSLPEDFSSPARREYRASLDSSRFWKAAADEINSIRSSQSEIEGTGVMGDLPVVVLSHGRDDPNLLLPGMTQVQAEQVWRASQKNLAAQSSDSVMMQAADSGHNIMLDQPNRIAKAVALILRAVRQNRRVRDLKPSDE